MESSKRFVTCDDAKDLDLVVFLSGLGFEPAKIRGQDYWYLSPLRTENTPSFKVNRKLNRWCDHGLGKGGNLVDFGILYNDCPVKDFLELLGRSTVPTMPVKLSLLLHQNDLSRLKILHETDLNSARLLNYLKVRHVSASVAGHYCREVTYQVGARKYKAIGFKNHSGGYELPSSSFNGSNFPKDVATFLHGAKQMTVFEGFFDFLSFSAIVSQKGKQITDFTILNSVAFFEKSRPLMQGYDQINLYLDRDTAGHNCSLRAQSLSKK